jgi:Reverse transcriptase (RNA-dependent DNA polymerase)
MSNSCPLLDNLNSNPDLQIPPPPATTDPHTFNPNLPSPIISSLFHDHDSLLKLHPTNPHHILASLNIQSLMSKHPSLTTLLTDSPFHVLALQETWHIQHTELVHIPGYNFIHTHRPKGRGGGVGFYVMEHLKFKILQQYSPFIANSFECLSIEVDFGPKSFIFSSIYRSPTPPNNTTHSAHMDSFTDNLDALLSALSLHRLPVFVCLDSNINLLTHSSTAANYSNIYSSYGFTQLILKATRIQGNSTTLIDHILTNAPITSINTGVILNDISDHFPVFAIIPVKGTRAREGQILTRKITTEKLRNFKNQLESLSWEDVLSCNDADIAYEHFFSDFKTLFDLNFPPTSRKFNKNFHKIKNFMTSGLLVSRRTKLTLHKKSISEPTAANISAFKSYRNIYNRLVRASKKMYYDSNLKKAKKNPKKTWALLKMAIGHPSKNEKIDKVTVENVEISSPTKIASAFNTFFAGAPKKIVNDIPQTNVPPESFLPPINYPEFKFLGTSQAEVVSIIRAMQSKSSTDLDGISMKVLKYVALEISFPLAHVINLSLGQGKFPKLMKAGRIVPVHKSGDSKNCDNYRPIALLNTFSKILEKVAANRLVSHLETHKILDLNQFGFQRARNTEHNLLQVVNFISNEINNGNYCVGVFLDLRKAFDTCSHDILLKKMSHYGVKGVALDWFTSYLQDRTQKVDIEGNLSHSCSIDMSVIQGSILGPILFLIQINDLPKSSSLKTFLFADDTQGLKGGKNLANLLDDVNHELRKWAVWFMANKMAVNTTKTKYIIFHGKGRSLNMEGRELVFDCNPPGVAANPALISTLERIHNNHISLDSRSYKLLGILLDENLSFNANTDLLLSKLSKSSFIINRSKNFLPKSSLLTLYYSLFHSHLSYCTTIASCTSKTNVEKIFKAQKKVIRAITNSPYNAHTEPLFTSLGILPYTKLITQSQLHFMHSYHYKYSPPTFTNTWTLNSERVPEMNLRNADDYFIPRPHLASFTRFPLYSFPKAWNEAGPAKFHANRALFRSQLKIELLNNQIAQPAD